MFGNLGKVTRSGSIFFVSGFRYGEIISSRNNSSMRAKWRETFVKARQRLDALPPPEVASQPPGWACPACGKVKPGSRRWAKGVCLSCCRLRRLVRFEFLLARETCRLTQAEFARRCGWSHGYQSKLERAGAAKRRVVATALRVAREVMNARDEGVV